MRSGAARRLLSSQQGCQGRALVWMPDLGWQRLLSRRGQSQHSVCICSEAKAQRMHQHETDHAP